MAPALRSPQPSVFMMNCTYLDAKQKFALYAPAFSGRSRLEPTLRDRAGFANVEGSDFLNQMLYLDTKIFMASLNRTYDDMLGMASSVEVRVPFLDRELAEFVA
jgi:asparagine synthase (glutamine-hydrolysing)